MTIAPSTTALRSSAFALLGRVLHWLDLVPYTLLAIPLRLAVATVFWNSAIAHLANWQTTLELFETEYTLPFLPSMQTSASVAWGEYGGIAFRRPDSSPIRAQR